MKDFLLEKFESQTKRDRWIEQIAADLGEKIKKFVGAGSFGWTYETKSGKILKITGDPVEIKFAYKLSKIKWWFQYVINYYNVGKTNKKVYDSESEEKRPLYYILMDKVYPVEFTDTDIGTAADIGIAIDQAYQHLIQYNVEYYNNIMDYEIVDESIEDNCGDNENIMRIAREIYPHIINIVKELKKLGIRETDFHSGNLGWANDETKLVLYDLGGYITNSTGINIRGKLPKIKLKGKKVSENIITKFLEFEINESSFDFKKDRLNSQPYWHFIDNNGTNHILKFKDLNDTVLIFHDLTLDFPYENELKERYMKRVDASTFINMIRSKSTIKNLRPAIPAEIEKIEMFLSANKYNL